jgi:hypothetical protein
MIGMYGMEGHVDKKSYKNNLRRGLYEKKIT